MIFFVELWGFKEKTVKLANSRQVRRDLFRVITTRKLIFNPSFNSLKLN